MEKPYYIKDSGIHGRGLFAARQIKSGEFITEYLGEIIDKEESNRRGLAREEASKVSGDGCVYIFELDENRDLDGAFEYNDARLINHACRTNCEAVMEGDKIIFYATKDINQDEEILYNYGYALEHFLDHPCRCGFPECVGYIVAVEDRKKLRRILKGKRPKR